MEGKKVHRSKQDDSIRTGRKLSSSGHRSGKNQDDLIGQEERQGGGEGGGGSSGGLVVTHGKTEVVSTSYLLGSSDEGIGGGEEGRGGGKDIHPSKKMKKKKKTDSEGEGDGNTEEIMRSRTLVMDDSGGQHDDLVMRLDKKFCHSSSHSSMVRS